MNIKIIAVGKIKENAFKLAIDEYVKRLSGYCSLSIVEVPAQSIMDDTLADKYMDEEAEKILANIKKHSYIITLEIEGKSLTSVEFADKLKSLSNDGVNEIIFIIGGANGLSEKIKKLSDFKLSFSKMTFPHRLARVMLVEQLYRAMKILSNEPYHK